MRRWIVSLVAGMLLCGAAAPGRAQVRDSSPADTLPAPDLPSHIARPIIEFFNEPTTIHFSGRTRVPAGRTVTGNVAVLGGPVVLAGQIDGNVVVIDGNVELLPGSSVTGDLTVVRGVVIGRENAALGGELLVYSEQLRYRRSGEGIVYLGDDELPTAPPREGEGRLARSDFLLTTGRSYNRVEGLPITFGPIIETAGSNPLRVRAMAVYRTESGATLDPSRLGYSLRIEQFLGGRGSLRVGGSVYSAIDPIEDRYVSDIENSLSTFLLHRDFRDYYERTGWSAYASLEPRGRPWGVTLEGRIERHATLAGGSPWTVFRNQENWRPQPLVAEGRATVLGLAGHFDTRSSATDPSHGWYLTGRVEQTLHADLTRPEAIAAAPLPIAEPVVLPAEHFGGWRTGTVDIRRYSRLSPDTRLNLRVLTGGSLNGSSLPPQRQHALGGEGSLPAYALFRLDCAARGQGVYRAEDTFVPVTSTRDLPPLFVPAYGCDQFALFQAEFRGKLSLRFGWGDTSWGDGRSHGWDLGWAASPSWSAFMDAGRGWSHGRASEDLALDLGVGLMFDRVGVYAAAPLTGAGGLNLFVRLDPRF